MVFAKNGGIEMPDLCGIHQNHKDMIHDTSALLSALRQQTREFLDTVGKDWADVPVEQWTASPAPGAWSAAQCLAHLNFYGQHYLPAIRAAMAGARGSSRRPSANFRTGWLGGYFTGLMEADGSGKPKTKMASPKNAQPQATPDAAAVRAAFIAQQHEMLALLDMAETVNLGKIRVPTSLSPLLRLKLGDTLRFCTAHHHRHLMQAQRALSHGALQRTAAM